MKQEALIKGLLFHITQDNVYSRTSVHRLTTAI